MHNLKAVVLKFIDFRKAFNSHRGQIGLMHNDARACALTPDRYTDYFEILSDALKGDKLAPFLFAIVLDYTMGQVIDGKEEELSFKLYRKRKDGNIQQ